MIYIKICGITRLEDALAAIVAGADLLGFNFYPSSPRYIPPERCAGITRTLHKLHPNVIRVGVFVNASATEIRETFDLCHLHLAQLHGDESLSLVEELSPRAYKAVRSPNTGENTAFARFGPAQGPGLLLDARVAGVYGGSGVTADWEAAGALAQKIPLLLAGGLTPENVGAAIRCVHPWGVDTASGVESSPGIKDPAKMRRFVAAARNAETITTGSEHDHLATP